ncbi:MAG: carboxypeptidase-like regulatory domain-containing protein [Saprospiraceae bacterium]
MKNYPLIILLFLLLSGSLMAQNPNRVTIFGHITDTLGMEIPFVTVMLLTPEDSTLVNFTRSDEQGNFSFSKVKNTLPV